MTRPPAVGTTQTRTVTFDDDVVAMALQPFGGAVDGRVPSAVLSGLAAALTTDVAARGAAPAAVSVHASGKVLVGDTVTARGVVAAWDSERGLLTVDVTFTNQRNEGVARGTLVVRAPRPAGLTLAGG